MASILTNKQVILCCIFRLKIVRMTKEFLFTIALFGALGATAQEQDSLFAAKKDGKWVLRYTAKPREHAAMLAKRFYMSESQLEELNSENTMNKLSEGDPIYIPLSKSNNYYTSKPSPLKSQHVHELYYKVGQRDDMATIGNYSTIPKQQLQKWNNMHGYNLTPGEVLFVGWVKYMEKDTADPTTLQAYPAEIKKVEKDTTTAMTEAVPGGMDTVFNKQTNNGLNLLTEKGTAAFFDKPGKSTIFYAFHNELQRGAIVKVYNPGSGKTIYAKVIGPIPDTKLYANTIIGISSNAKEALGVNDARAWCELSYAAN